MDKAPRTIQEAWALPEILCPLVRRYTVRQADGTDLRIDEPRKLGSHGFSPKDIVAFTDKDGRPMEVVDLEEGYFKTPSLVYGV